MAMSMTPTAPLDAWALMVYKAHWTILSIMRAPTRSIKVGLLACSPCFV
jgi:hypothetical protein